MNWEQLFDDLEGQLASEWEAERAALAAESERLRIAKLSLHARLQALRDRNILVRLHSNRSTLVRLDAIGTDWLGLTTRDGGRTLLVPLDALDYIEASHGDVLASVEDREEPAPSVRDRMTLGFILRDLARRRTPVRLGLRDGAEMFGTIDRAGADHLDIAIHDAGEPRRAQSVRAYRVVSVTALSWVEPAT